jgi:hypothetical protein
MRTGASVDVLEGVPEQGWIDLCAQLAQGVKIGDALEDLFIPMVSYRAAMAGDPKIRERVAASRAVWDNRNWPEEKLMEIFLAIAGGSSLKDVAKEMGFVPQSFHALRIRDDYVSESYELSLKIQTEGLVDEMREIVDSTKNDTMPDGNGGTRSNGAGPQRDRLRFEMRKWAASKLLRRTYGDKTEIDLTVDVVGNLAEKLDSARRRKEAAYAQLKDVIDVGQQDPS